MQGVTGPTTKAELQKKSANTLASRNAATVATTVDNITSCIYTGAAGSDTKYTWYVRNLSLSSFVPFDDDVIETACSKLKEIFTDSVVTSTKTPSLTNPEWIDYSITVDWS